MRPRIPIVALFALLVLGAPPVSSKAPSRQFELTQALRDIEEGRDVHAAISRISFLGREAQASTALARNLHAYDVNLRRRSAEALARLAGRAQLAALKEGALDEDGAVRMSVATALGRAGRGAVPTLFELASDKTYGVRREAARSLGKVGTPKDGVKLFGRLEAEPELEVQTAIVLAAGETRAKALRPKLVPLLESGSEGTRQAATRALCLLGASEGFAQVKKQLSAENLYARLAAIELLAGVPLKQVSPLLNPLLEDKEPKLRAVAARALAQAGEPRARTWLILAAEQAGPGNRGPYLTELETLGVTEVESNRVLRKAGLKP